MKKQLLVVDITNYSNDEKAELQDVVAGVTNGQYVVEEVLE